MDNNKYDAYYPDLQRYLKSTDDDKNNLLNLLERGHHVIQSYCGVFGLDNLAGRNLVFNWVRFEWQGVSEHFFDSFLIDINNLRMNLWMDGDSDVEEI